LAAAIPVPEARGSHFRHSGAISTALLSEQIPYTFHSPSSSQ
jgi:hypothetical protein